MSRIIKSAREWWLIALLFALVGISAFPTAIEGIYPVIDTVGSNMNSMAVQQPVYHPGEKVIAFFQFQKQRSVVGMIKWKLIPDRPESRAYNFPGRPVASPAGIISHWAGVEPIPTDCVSGQYHFEGTLVYPLLFGSVSYPLSTSCFEVRTK